MASRNTIILSSLSHGSIFLGIFYFSFLIPLLILFLSENPIVKANAKEALNYLINLYILYVINTILLILVVFSTWEYTLIITILSIVGLILLIVLSPILIMRTFILPIIAIKSVIRHPEQPYRYSKIYRFIR